MSQGTGRASGERGYSYDTVWTLLDLAQQTVRRAEALCDDDNRDRIDTVLAGEAVDAIRRAKIARFQVLPRG